MESWVPGRRKVGSSLTAQERRVTSFHIASIAGRFWLVLPGFKCALWVLSRDQRIAVTCVQRLRKTLSGVSVEHGPTKADT